MPNLVGYSPNPNTLTNYFADSIKQERQINLKPNAIRHLIDVADLPGILNEIKARYGKNSNTINVETDQPLSALTILSLLENIFNKKAKVLIPDEFIDIENFPMINDPTSINFIYKTNQDYHLNLLNKYYST